jgi:hypothetical protein
MVDSFVVKRVYNMTYNQNISFQSKKNGLIFKLTILPEDTVNINITYSQKTQKENIYILESTKTWNSPLRFADYSLTFDSTVSIKQVSYKPDSIKDGEYYWHKTDFFPDRNFVISVEK